MATYIKVNPKVAQYLGLTEKRYQFECGNYMLWQGDLLAFSPLSDMDGILRRIGGVAMTHSQALAEQRHATCIELPEASEPRFRMGGAEETSEVTAEAAAEETVEETAEEQEVEPDNSDPQ